MKLKRLFCGFFTLAVLISFLPARSVFAAEESESNINDAFDISHAVKYKDYLQQYSDAKQENEGAIIPAEIEKFTAGGDGFSVGTLPDGKKALYTPEKGSAAFPITVEKAGFYRVRIEYYSLEGNGSSATREIKINGESPFYEASLLEFSRVWKDIYLENSKDMIGNDILPTQQEMPQTEVKYLRNQTASSYDILYFYLAEGEHTLSLEGIREPLAVVALQLEGKSEYVKYSDYNKQNISAGLSVKKEWLPIQGEASLVKSDPTIYPLADRTSVLTEPVSDYLIRYNTIGGTKWQTTGQWIEWELAVPEDGLYPISLRYKQNQKQNSTVYRRLYINGEVPFEEADMIAFPFTNGFDALTIGADQEPYYFNFKKGEKYKLRLEVIPGVFGGVLEEAEAILADLNLVYREILTITGPSPDLYRDYDFKAMLPQTLEKMKTLEEQLSALEEKIKQITKLNNSSELSSIQRLKKTLNNMLSDNNTIAGRFKNFQNEISGLASWIHETKAQPLEIDYFIVGDIAESIPIKAGFFKTVYYYIKQFFASFVIDYSQMGQLDKSDGENITVWIESGRDQLQIIRALINRDYTPTSKKGVNLQLVAPGSLLPAIIAGRGPDVALQRAQGDPMNYAYRNAVADLSEYENLDKILERFSPEALVPFKFDEKIYALPETQSFPMLFYRKDILNTLGITKKDIATWDGIYKIVVPELQKKHLDFGLSPSIASFLMMLYQDGGRLYSENADSVLLNTQESVALFKSFTRLYTEYLQPVAFDFSNRFRTGQMPIAVTDFTAYNQLSIFAPEIAGLWEMTSVPGTLKSDGSVDHSSILSVTGSMIFQHSNKKEDAFEFLNWWTKAETQTQFGKDIESVLGTSARYVSANKESFESVAWDEQIRLAIVEQAKSAYAVREIPGGYYTGRYFEFAFREVINEARDERSALNDAVENIDSEIAAKRKEFGLDK